MNKRWIGAAMSGVFFCAACTLGAQTAALTGTKDAERVAKNKQTVLSRLKRGEVTYRGDKPGEIRIRWEWYDKVVRSYIYEKAALIQEQSADSMYVLRVGWVYRDMKTTFQELYGLAAADDDKLLPILSYQAMVRAMPQSTLAGLTLLGKHGEVKGTQVRKYAVKTLLADQVVYHLEYVDATGKKKNTLMGLSYDAFTLRWKDIKDRVADEVSAAKEIEDLQLERDALFPEETQGKSAKAAE
jgi:hypothetical protein